MAKKAKSKTVRMDDKAANPGDRMKHALLLEILIRTRSWAKVAYCETHGGAGVYEENNQKEKPHIRNLRDTVLWQQMRQAGERQSPPGEGTDAGAGAEYFARLRDWWFDPSQTAQYPGSAKLAAVCLGQLRPHTGYELRLTENDPATFKRLKRAVSGNSATVRNGSFVGELTWLTEPDCLVLMVDPFRCIESFDTFGEQCGFEEGDIDHKTVSRILEDCQQKSAAVIHIWWSKGGKDGAVSKKLADSHQKTRQLLNAWARSEEGRAYRQFHDVHNHASALVGIGAGSTIVESLPKRAAWELSWLKSVIYELPTDTPDTEDATVEVFDNGHF